MVETIGAIEPPCVGSNETDMCIWGGTNISSFTISNVFEHIAGACYAGNMNPWKYIWKLMVLGRIRSFIWMIHHYRNMTNQYLNVLKLMDPYREDCAGHE